MKKNGLLLVNLGSPASPSTTDVKKYLKQFLSDQNVIEMPAALWQPILRGIILPLRSWRSATFYQNSWLAQGSPLIVNTQRLAKKVQQLLPNWIVKIAMTYGQPSIATTLKKLQSECEQITVISLFPHFTKSTTQSIIDQVKVVAPTAQIIDRFADNERYLEILARQIQTSWDQGQYDRLLISYHGIPTAMVKKGDPYQEETKRTTAELSERLKIPTDKIKMVYQSKFGPMPWLKPYLRNVLTNEAQLGHRNLLLISPSFTTDCLETLEENKVQNYQFFRENGGDNLVTIPALNDNEEFADLLAKLAQREELA